MNDYLLTVLAREHMARVSREATVASLIRSADRDPERRTRRRRGMRRRPRHA